MPHRSEGRHTGEKGLWTPASAQPEGGAIGVVHLAAEYWWLARTGGLAEAVAERCRPPPGDPGCPSFPRHRLARGQRPPRLSAGCPLKVQVGSGSRRDSSIPQPPFWGRYRECSA